MDEYINFRESPTYYDNVNYPRGFSKHGDFTIREAEALHRYGRILANLCEGLAQAATEDEKRFVQVCAGALEPGTYLEKLWFKYQSKIKSKQVFYGLSSATLKFSGSADAEYDPV